MTIHSYDHTAQHETTIGVHSQPIRCVEYSKNDGLLLTGGWDGVVKVWDVRQAACVYSLQQPGKVYFPTLFFLLFFTLSFFLPFCFPHLLQNKKEKTNNIQLYRIGLHTCTMHKQVCRRHIWSFCDGL